MTVWTPRATVACVVFQNGRYLLVEERDKTTGRMVFNQPAGHLDAHESLLEAARRETLEETGWRVEPVALLSIALYRVQEKDLTFHRTTFLADAVEHLESAEIDADITAVHWLDYDEVCSISDKLRSPLVLASIERHRAGIRFPLDVIDTQ